MLTPHFFPGLLRSFLVADLRPWSVLDLEDAVDFFERKAGGFDVEEPDDWQPSQIEHGEDYVEAPTDRIDAFEGLSVVVKYSTQCSTYQLA